MEQQSSTGHLVTSVRDLRKRYGGCDVLAGIDLDISADETYALIGPNGAGKSTTIEVLEGVRRPESGEVRVFDENPLTASRPWPRS